MTKVGDLKIEEGEKEYVINEVNSLKTMGALFTKEADSMSAMIFRMNKADKAMWMDMKFLQQERNCGGSETQKIQGGGAIVYSSPM